MWSQIAPAACGAHVAKETALRWDRPVFPGRSGSQGRPPRPDTDGRAVTEGALSADLARLVWRPAGVDADVLRNRFGGLAVANPREPRCGLALLLSNVGVVEASRSSYSGSPSEWCGGLGCRLWAVVPRPDRP